MIKLLDILLENNTLSGLTDIIQKDFPELEDQFIDIGILYNKAKKMANEYKILSGDDSDFKKMEFEFENYLKDLEKTINLYNRSTDEVLRKKLFNTIQKDILDYYLKYFKERLDFFVKKVSWTKNSPLKSDLDSEYNSLMNKKL